MLGETENAKSDLQISIFQSLMKIVGSFSLLLPIAEPNQFEETVSRFMKLDETFEIRKLNPYVVVPVLIIIAQGYMRLGNSEKALDYLDDYSKMVAFEFYPLKFRSTPFFDKIEDWYETFDLGNTTPRDEVIIRQSTLDVLVNNPIFMPLKENERFIHLVNRIGGC